jgi:uncharacterized membrane protein YdjX (TVP38/TMEM64 family)
MMYTSIRRYEGLSPDTIEEIIKLVEEGWALLMFVIIYVVGVCLFLPGTLLTALGAALFGPLSPFTLCLWLLQSVKTIG